MPTLADRVRPCGVVCEHVEAAETGFETDDIESFKSIHYYKFAAGRGTARENKNGQDLARSRLCMLAVKLSRFRLSGIICKK